MSLPGLFRTDFRLHRYGGRATREWAASRGGRTRATAEAGRIHRVPAGGDCCRIANLLRASGTIEYMSAQGIVPQSQFASWRVPQFAHAIEYSLDVAEEIRAFACDELLQLSHGGDEVGGVLFGTRREDVIQIVTWRPIACEHAHGESLQLCSSDRMNLAVQLEVARRNPDLKDLRPVGWFVSHLRSDVCLSPSDLEIYNGFFPEAWQVALVICPKEGGRAKAGFFVREAEGKVVAEACYQCFDLEPTATREQAPAVRHVQAPVPPALEFSAPTFQSPSFQIDDRVPTRERWLWAIPVLLAIGIAAFMLYQRRAPNLSIALRAVGEGQTVQLSWDADSRALRDSDHAAIEISDGGKTSQVSLNIDQLRAGKMSYLRQSGDIGFAMTVYPANGDPIHDSTRLIAPAFNSPSKAPETIAPAFNAPAQAPEPIAPAPPAAQHDALEQQVQYLRQSLGREHARADELQNLVRILENRLGIPHEEPSATPPR